MGKNKTIKVLLIISLVVLFSGCYPENRILLDPIEINTPEGYHAIKQYPSGKFIITPVYAEVEENKLRKNEIDHITDKSVDLNKIIFNIYLGKDIKEMQEHFEITKGHLDYWHGEDVSKTVKKILIHTRNNKIDLITVWLKDYSKRNFDILKLQLKKEYQKYKIEKSKNLNKIWGNNLMGKQYGLEFEVTIDNLPINIMLLLTNNSSIAEDELTISYVLLNF